MLSTPLGAALLALALAQEPTRDEHSPESAGELFRTRCAACHVPPDPRFAVERAWLAQVSDTA
jgi:mono/diheme cytochrome c family protein